jgi:hypothetical protein
MSQLTIQDINAAIIGGSFTNEQLNSIVDAVKYARANLVKQARYSIKPGTDVQFYSEKRNSTIRGKVAKIALKYATVTTPQGTWKVPMNMLTVA